MRPVRIFSIVYGQRFIDWFERGCIRSLKWPKNLAALRMAEAWDVWTMPADEDRVRWLAESLGIPIETHLLSPYSDGDDAARKEQLRLALTFQMRACRDSKAFLWIAPDSIFGDGSIASFMALGSVPGICVATAPMRVNADGFIEAMHNPMSNADLVRLSFERMHRGFRDANAELPETNSYISGVSWRQIGEGLYAVTHLKHSSYLMQPTKKDVDWWERMNKFGAYDHSLPKLLVADQRQRVIGSSDAAFVAELTPEDVGVPKLKPTDPNEPDRYDHEQHGHHAVNRNVVCIWRAA